MRGCYAFMKKEGLEMLRTYRLLITVLVFMAMGIMNPVFAKLTPELLSAFSVEGMSITLAEPTALDAWTQFFKNMTSIGFIVLIIFTGTSITRELSSGTLIPVLTKGLSRNAVVTAKFIMAVILWTLGYVIAYGTSHIYTIYLFEAVELAHLFAAVFAMWLFGILLIAVLMFGGILTGSTAGCLLFTAVGIGIMFLLNLFPAVHSWNPLTLAADNMELLKGSIQTEVMIKAATSAGMLVVVLLAGSYGIFQKRKL